MNEFNFHHSTGVIIGASGGIGKDFTDILTSRYEAKTFKASRSNTDHYFVDVKDEASIKDFSNRIDDRSLDFICYFVGSLNVEKSLRDLKPEKLIEAFSVNAIGFALICKHLKKKLKKKTPTFIMSLSAMVGSLEDNKLGGWYSYRTSKTALNMFVQNISIELSRESFKTKVVAIHPGTTQTKLSEKHLSGIKHKIMSKEESAEQLIHFLSQYDDYENGSFYHSNSTRIPW